MALDDARPTPRLSGNEVDLLAVMANGSEPGWQSIPQLIARHGLTRSPASVSRTMTALIGKQLATRQYSDDAVQYRITPAGVAWLTRIAEPCQVCGEPVIGLLCPTCAGGHESEVRRAFPPGFITAVWQNCPAGMAALITRWPAPDMGSYCYADADTIGRVAASMAADPEQNDGVLMIATVDRDGAVVPYPVSEVAR